MLKEKEIMLDFLDKLQEQGWSYLDNLQYGRGEKTHTAIYESKLFPQIRKINPQCTDSAIMKGIEALFNNSKDNQEAFNYLRNGIIINIQGENKKVKFIDFDNPQQNKFSYFPQLRIRTKHDNYWEPDLILFINYLPVVVLEFKDQTRAGRKWKEEAFRQIKDYEKDLPALFLLNAFNVLSNGDGDNYERLVGTITSEIFHYTPWKSEKNNLFAPKTILDIIQNYIVFNSEKIKKIARYHQYDCVKKTLRVMEKSSLKGGVNAHTTGSGKSDTMAFLANQLRRKHSDCTIIVITDRNELDRQIYERFREYEDTFFTLGDLVVIEDINKLKKTLEKEPNRGKIIFALVQKFQDLVDLKENKITFENKAGVFVFIDEAHRSQNLIVDAENKKVSWAWEMRRVFPQAFFLGFTATPIEGKTYEEIGPPIHTYSAHQAIQNEIIVNIIYEEAYKFLPETHWDEEKFAKIFPKKDETFIDKRKSIKSRKDLFFESPQRIKIMGDFFKKDYENFSRQHYLKGKPKVMYMAYNIEAAHRLFKELQKDPHYQNKACLIVSKQHHYQSSELINAIGKEKENIRNFKDPQSDLNIAIVVDKLTTGFNMENLERIYLDQPITAPHNFFQKISRVNRKYSDKNQGFVVDLVGNEETYQKVLIEYFDDKSGSEYGDGKIENLWKFFANFCPREELYQKLFNHRQINQKTFFDEALNYCAKKIEEERKEFFSETKTLRLTLSSRWYITGKEKVEKKKNLEFVNWCFRLGCHFNFDFSGEPTAEDEEKNRIAEAGKVENASWEAINFAEIDFNNFDFSQIIQRSMSIDPKKYPDIRRWALEGKIKKNLDRRRKWWFSVKEWEEKFQNLLKKYNENKLNIHDLNSQLAELNEELEKENQEVNQKLEKDTDYPLRKKLIEKLPLDKRKNDNFVSEMIEWFLKLNKDIPDWSLREDERRKARKDIDEKTKKYFREKMPQKEREELILLLENYFLSEYYSFQKNRS
jgi:type I restriction enzyme R subunit